MDALEFAQRVFRRGFAAIVSPEQRIQQLVLLIRKCSICVVIAALLLLRTPAPSQAASNNSYSLQNSDREAIADLARTEIAAGRIPGAVIVVGNGSRILLRRAFGLRAFRPRALPMMPDTIFDLASVTKVVATTPAIMQLAEQGKLLLDSPVASYWPEFGSNTKGAITVRDLLTHYSGLPADLDVRREWSGYNTAMRMIVAEKPRASPRTRYLYSSINFEALGELVGRLSGVPLDKYCAEHIFKPLGMKDTGFRPALALHDRIAPTEDTQGKVHWGDVHDATSRWMGGAAGHAGLFSTADDLTIFARMMVGNGRTNGVRVLSASSVKKMTTPQSPAGASRARGLGWDLGGPDGNPLFPAGSYGHLGFTGTMIWIDPDSETFVVVLTNRVYPDGKGDAGPLRKGVLALVTKALHLSIESKR
jgi:CubicO group peptidase (beta-lactamase class C family)